MDRTWLASTWDMLWEKHDQVKELLSFFVKPTNTLSNQKKADRKSVV